ncbi:sulfatase-like hydrolase/transferase [Halalkalibaculum sp. DA3122]|uniref:sulfatase-like hydrolase/transferase n=1 Tax=Halalkalibaculum sp. DA3122 TaxID=3373607 RepID=UPI003755317F
MEKTFKILAILLILVWSQAIPCIGQSEPPEKPNILVIMPDDLGWHDVGYQGSSIKTPNIDKLAQSGLILDQHYVMPTCTPTRVSLLTGRYASRYGVTGPDYGEVIDRGDPTLASLLSRSGYFTAIAGKWHLGSPPHTPLKYGLDSSYGYFDGQIDPYTHNYKMKTKLTSRKSWHRNDEYLDEEGHATDLITDEAIRIIEKDREQPFFLFVAYSVPHFPLDEPEKWTSNYEDVQMSPSRKWFAASVTHMDDGIGQIMEALERTGQRKNTLILFASDNGGQHSWHSDTEYRGRYADKPHRVLGNNFPLRGWKGDLYEGGIRVPAVVNWPRVFEPGVVEVPLHIADWLPTFLALADGSEHVTNRALDGKNIWPALTGEAEGYSDRTLYWKTGGEYAVRQGDWKLIVQRNDQAKELYNLADDFRETTDLSDEEPEKVNQMLNLLGTLKK